MDGNTTNLFFFFMQASQRLEVNSSPAVDEKDSSMHNSSLSHCEKSFCIVNTTSTLIQQMK